MNYLNDSGVEARVYYPVPLHLQACFAFLGYKSGAFPGSERAMEEVLSLPVYAELTLEEKEGIVSHIRNFFEE
jgi:dTDP-4-amino-4,6-dideoxygalactose transaminase